LLPCAEHAGLVSVAWSEPRGAWSMGSTELRGAWAMAELLTTRSASLISPRARDRARATLAGRGCCASLLRLSLRMCESIAWPGCGGCGGCGGTLADMALNRVGLKLGCPPPAVSCMSGGKPLGGAGGAPLGSDFRCTLLADARLGGARVEFFDEYSEEVLCIVRRTGTALAPVGLRSPSSACAAATHSA
jgi:hypothetical protein